MATSQTLDLSKIDPPVWRVLAGGDVFGPFTLGQIKAYLEEGRVQPGTPLARGDGAPFRPAVEFDTVFAGHDTRPNGPRNFLLVLPQGASDTLLGRLAELGACLEATAGVFMIRARLPISEMRAAIAPLAGGEMILVDASANRLAWSGLDPQSDRALRALWSRPAESTSAAV